MCRKDTSILHLEDIIMLGAMGPPGGGRNNVTARFARHFNVLGIESFDEETLKNIFTPIMDWYFDVGFEPNLKKFSRVCIQKSFSHNVLAFPLTSFCLYE